MNRQIGLIASLVVLTALVGAVGGWVGARYGLESGRPQPSLDTVLHRDLHLTRDQSRRIGHLEAAFAARRVALEAEMQAANADLAQAIATQHVYGPDAERAIGRFHAAMGALQRETVIHVLAMRDVLDADQAALFDKTVTQSLAPGA